jgi:hypothetical protein
MIAAIPNVAAAGYSFYLSWEVAWVGILIFIIAKMLGK